MQAADEITRAHAPVKIVVGGVTWHVRPGWEWLVYGQGVPNWLHLVAEPKAEPIKRNPAREVWHVAVADQQFYVKLYTERGLVGKLRSLVRGQGCELEWRAGKHAQRHGIPTVETIAYGTRGRSGPGVLITRALENAVPLQDFWSDRVLPSSPAVRRHRTDAVIEAAAATVARAHQYGFLHRDLHAGNLLAVEDPDGSLRVVFVDLHNVRMGRRVSDRRAIVNLAQLNQWFSRHASRTDRLRFLRHYLAFRKDLSRRADTGPPVQLSYREVVAAFDRAARRHRRRLWAKRDRIAMRDGKYFCRLRIRGGLRAHAFLRAKRVVQGSRASKTQFTRAQWRRWLADPLELLRHDRASLIKDSHTAYVGRSHLPIPGEPLAVICKRARPRTRVKKLYYMFSRSRNRRNWIRGYQLLNRELPTARPLAILERRFAGLLLDSLILTEALPDARDFDAVLRMDLLHEDPETIRRAKQQLLDALVGLICDMQSKGFGHHDFKASNLMVQWDRDSDERPRLSLIDLDGLVLRRRLSRRERLRPLIRLNVSLDEARVVTRADRLRFLRSYLSSAGLRELDWKALWREISRNSERKREHKDRRREWKLKHYGRT